MDNTIIQQGRFTQGATAANVTLQIRSDVDWIKVYNQTVLEAAGGGNGAEFYFQRGMTNGTGWKYVKEATIGALVPSALAANTGFFLVDSSVQGTAATIVSTGITNATPPVVTVGSTATLATGDVVRVTTSTGALNLSGIDYTINVINGTTFGLTYMVAAGTATAANINKVNFDPLYYPRRRVISAITLGATTVVKMTVTHGYVVGQLVRLNIPATSGTVELNGVTGAITAISTANNTITLNIDSTGFTTFVFPAAAAVPFTPAEVVPVGEDTASALTAGTDILSDATINQGFIGVTMIAGALAPAGAANSTSYWIAGKSFSVNNQ